MTICPHTIRVIEDWAGKKVVNNTAKSTTRGATGFGSGFPGNSSGISKSLGKFNNTTSIKINNNKVREGAQTP